MRSVFFAAIIGIFILSLPLSVAPVAAQVYAITTVDTLNVRDKANGSVIDRLSGRTPVAIQKVEGGWAEIVYFPKSGALRRGWVATQHLHVLRGRGVAGTGDSYRTSRGADFTVSVSDADLDCNEGFDGGYDSCTVTVSFDVHTDYNGNDNPSVEVECEADLSYATRDGFMMPASEEESETVYLYSGYTSESVEIEFRFFAVEPVTRVQLNDVSCTISSVY